jgi:integrase
LCPIAKIALAKRYTEYRWSPNRLRHSAATEVRRRFGLEAAQHVLGHASANTTEIYAERDAAAAQEIARKIG